MYICIYTTTGASYPPHPMGGGTRDTGPYIYTHNYMTIYNDIIYIYVLQYPNDVNMAYDVICISCVYIYISFSYKIIHMDCTS